MLRNYFVIALRHLDSDRFYSLINVGGLTLGLTACLVISAFVRFELSYDRFNENADRIVRIDWEVQLGAVNTYNAAVTPPMAEAFAADFPDVEAAARMRTLGSFSFRGSGETIVEQRVVFADNDLFRIFTLPFVAGNPGAALKHPHSMVISETCAARYFPEESALGKTLIKDNTTAYTITGIIRDIPANSHFHYDVFLSMEGLDESKSGNWIGGPYNTYLLMRPGADLVAFENKLPGFVRQYVMPYAASVLGDEFIGQFQAQSTNYLKLHVRPLTDIHLYSHLRNELEGNSDIKYVFIFSSVGVLILAIACINFMNLATARATRRAREVGIRKVMGSSRSRLALQFLLESFLISLLSVLLAVGAAELILPVFNAIAGLRLDLLYSITFILMLIALAAFVGVAAGLYPGIVLSSFRPAQVLKGNMPLGSPASLFQRGLVVFQFTISIFLTIATLAVYTQMKYMERAELGFVKEHIIRLSNARNVGARLFELKEIVKQNTLIANATVSSYFPGPRSARKTPLMWRYGAQPTPETSANLETWGVDHDYISTLGMTIVEGRDFSRDFKSDSTAVIINEAAVRQLDLQGSPIGQRLSMFAENGDGSADPTQLRTFTIVGVIKNFNYESLRQSITPLALFLEQTSGFLAVRYREGDTKEVIDVLRTAWSAFAPGEPFAYAFLDSDFHTFLNTEERLSGLLTLFTCLAIGIACLGLFALTAYTTGQRTKEIGIRKVMGASVTQIVVLLSTTFGKLILTSFIITIPIAIWGTRWYVQQYAYPATIGVTIYLQAGLLALGVAALTLSYQCIKAAKANPVESLKHD